MAYLLTTTGTGDGIGDGTGEGTGEGGVGGVGLSIFGTFSTATTDFFLFRTGEFSSDLVGAFRLGKLFCSSSCRWSSGNVSR